MLTIEHRAAPAPDPMLIELVAAPTANLAYLRVCDRSTDKQVSASLHRQVLQLLARTPGDLPRTEIRARLRVNNQRLGLCLGELEQLGRIHRAANGWRHVEPNGWCHVEQCDLILPGETEAGSAEVQPAKG